jgi:nitrogen fixation NifU-like protein
MSDQLYKEFILDLYRNPLNRGELVNPDVTHTEHNPTCGDDITVDLKFDANGRIQEIAHRGHGCAISIAAVSLMSDVVKGKDTNEVLALTLDDVIYELGVQIDYTREKCAMIGLRAVQHALSIKKTPSPNSLVEYI